MSSLQNKAGAGFAGSITLLSCREGLNAIGEESGLDFNACSGAAPLLLHAALQLSVV